MKNLLLAAMLTLVVACSSGGNSHHSPPPSPTASGWIIGPIIKGQNHSKGMPARPTAQGAGWYFAFPDPNGSVHYVQWFNPPSLVGAKQIVMRYSVTGGGFFASENVSQPATVALQFQRKGDDWSGKGAMVNYRWYSRQMPTLKAGEYTLTVPLQLSAWGNVYGKSDDAAAFAAAQANLSNIAVVFGSSSGAGHGVYSTQASRFTLLSLQVEK